MKVAVSCTGKDVNSQVDPRFGRTAFFLLVDTETLDFEVVSNSQNLQAAQGAGVQAASLIAQMKPAAVLTGHCGPKAFQVLQAAGIPVYVGVSGTVKEAVARFKKGDLTPSTAPNAPGHW
ncbi:NifB/NifX family molybdenum-iron cluster-binding protein [Desulfosoma caldarium]|uniref:Putative Fe-Mo cluster-binding NifX family protein n=1 Tax=Desulfosoma caldarium TaxID=610254 RepID=A0A3N1UXX1_9BACT|nr:NifB/NifX family molybdenum-iron cluster-binding protein [Desulfosoma caldarium]ROQ93387.1 putative Fe-Mo cluster-binding NifX family protein [Desulfosoma caldarium]